MIARLMKAGLFALALTIAPAAAQEQADGTAGSLFALMHGEWQGTANGIGPDGQPYTVTQTERAGPMVGGTVTVVEGRGYDEEGNLAFNAFGIISMNSETGQWEIRTYRDGQSGTFVMEVTGEDSYVWTIPLGPEGRGGEVRYSGTIDEQAWNEVGHFVPPGGEPMKILEMSLTRTGDSDWPLEGYIRS